MKGKLLASALIAALAANTASAEPQAAPILAGSWNVTSTFTNDSTCTGAKPGDVTAYVWILSQSGDGNIEISVQGETSFPKLSGKYDKEKKTLIVSSSESRKAASWFKLKLNDKGEFTGVRRFLAASGSAARSLCFGDSEVVAKRQ